MLCGLLSLFAGSTPAIAQAISRLPVINTVAGNGTAGYSGDGGVATSAELNGPHGVAVDASGNLYIADPANNRIREVAVATGVISTFAGNGAAGYSGDGGAATSAELDVPAGVAADSAGNLYIADQGNNVIRKVSTSGTITTIAGNHEEGYSGDNGQATNATLYAPAGVAIDSAGNLYIADEGNNRIRMVNTSGTITTVAGNGTAGYSGDSGPATSATLNEPSAIVLDGSNNLYIADTGNSVIRKVTNSTIATIVGYGAMGYTGDGFPATSATLDMPLGLEIDPSGNLYIADSRNNVVRRVDTAGVITTFVGDGPPLNTELRNPQGVVVDAQGNLYISDSGDNRVLEITTPAGNVLFPTVAVGSTSATVTIDLVANDPETKITGLMAPVSQGGKQEYTFTLESCSLNEPLDGNTSCEVAVKFAPAYPGVRTVPLQVATSAGTFSFGMSGVGTAPQVALSPGVPATSQLTLPEGPTAYAYSFVGGVVLDSAGNIYTELSDEGQNQIVEYPAGTNVPTVVLPTNNLLDNNAGTPPGLAMDGAGNLFIANPAQNCILKVAPASGTFTVVAGASATQSNSCEKGGYSGDNGLAINAKLNGPSSLAVDSAGNLYIADTLNLRVRKISAASGIITTVAGNGSGTQGGDNGPATSAGLYPDAVAVDSAGNLYIADFTNNRVRQVAAATGIITTVAGNGTAGYSGDNGPATDAELNEPVALALDSAGDIYIEDAANNVVRKVNPAGVIVSLPGTSVTAITEQANLWQQYVPFLRLALDSTGNLWSLGPFWSNVMNVSSSTLSFASTPIGTSSTQSVTVTNIGNAPLGFTVPASGQNPSVSTGFSLDSSSSCPQPGSSTVASGASCMFVFDFTSGTSAASGTASIMDNALNANLTQTVQLNGAAGNTVATTTTINVTTPVSGQTQVSATILATSGSAVPMGSVVFTVDGTAQPAAQVNSSGVATLAAAISNALAAGSHTINAAYTSSTPGFTNSVATLIFSVAAAPPPSVTITPGTSSLSVAPGSSVTDKLTLTSVGGYTGTLQFSCTNLPQNTTCSFQPSTVTLSSMSSPQTAVVTIQTSGGTAALRLPGPFLPQDGPLELAAAFWGPGLIAISFAGEKRRLPSRHFCLLIAALTVLAGSLVLSGCGSGGSASGNTTQNSPPSTPATPAGTSTVQISATAGSNTVQSFALTLTVQ
jgi:sugar lactone lactonase YvrE